MADIKIEELVQDIVKYFIKYPYQTIIALILGVLALAIPNPYSNMAIFFIEQLPVNSIWGNIKPMLYALLLIAEIITLKETILRLLKH